MSSRWPGDWNCTSCQHLNFSRRDACQHCGFMRPGAGLFDAAAAAAASSTRPGDWYCLCGCHNFAARPACHRCGGYKEATAIVCFDAGDDASAARAQAEWKNGDWLCTREGCNMHNFASRRECFRCKAPRGNGY